MARRTGRYHDWGKTYKEFSYAFLEAGKVITEDAKRDLTFVAEEYLDELNAEWPHSSSSTRTHWGAGGAPFQATAKFGGDRNHPWFTGQLHDSVAVRLAERNKTFAVRYMPPSATGGPQHTATIKGIIGADWAHEVAERKAPYYFLPGLQVQLVVGVPYAEKVNESPRHLGFFEELQVELINKVDSWVESGGLTKRTYVIDGKKHTYKRVR